MCGIVGYIGHREPSKIVIDGLRRLEYRGYDSAGIAVHHNQNGIDVTRAVGAVDKLDLLFAQRVFDEEARIAIGHTRWATHGVPAEHNAHPHMSMHGTISIVHNGIIENYETLKKKLVSEGYEFKSETDTEVLANWIEFHYNNIYSESDQDLAIAVRLALKDVVGAYAILVLDSHSQQVVAARKSSPLAIGLGNDEFVIASDATPIIEYTRDIVYLEDGQMAIIELHSQMNGGNPDVTFINLDNEVINPEIEHVDMELDQIEKGGFDTFMLKEIHEQPETVWNCLRGRLTDGEEPLMMGGVENVLPQLLRANKIFIIACGTSWHAGLIGKTMIETLTRVPVEVDYASEFRYRNPIIKPGDVVISISQSGETADTKAAMEMARERGATLFGIVNVVGSSIARMSDSGIYTHSGVEIGVASTKAFTGQVAALALLSIKMAKQLGSINDENHYRLKRSLSLIPEKIESILKQSEQIFKIADEYAIDQYNDFLFMGRGINFPIALEGALKLKEISYIHAEGYPAGEMKHGPIALIDENCPSIFIAPTDKSYDKILSNMQEVKARGGKVLAIVTEGDEAMSKVADHVIEIPSTDPLLTPLLTVIPLQLLSYRIASQRGKDVDKPRNLAKSVTVE
jgi:glucosamine--fructose-6-phosphate aminotransferase (isomerizing)